MRINAATGSVNWRKFLEQGGQLDTVTTALAASHDGLYVVAHVQAIAADGRNSHISTFVPMRASDGGFVADALALTHGDATGMGRHGAFSEGMVYVNSNTLFVTFMQTSDTMRPIGLDFLNLEYAGYFSIARIDPLGGVVTWHKEMPRRGFSASLAYKNYGVD